MRPPQQREAQLAAGQPARQPQTRITASFRSPTSTQRPPKSIRHPATLDNAQNLLKIQGSNEGTAFRGDQTAGLPLKASMKEKHFFFSKMRLRQGRCGSVPPTQWLCWAHTARSHWAKGCVGPSLEQSPRQHGCEGQCKTLASQGHCAARPRTLCGSGPCEPPPQAFPTGSRAVQ